MTTGSTSPRLFLTDSAGDYFVLTPEMKEPAKIPSENKHEVDEVLGKEGEVSGYIISPTLSAFPSYSPASAYNIRGACNGSCRRNFGLLGTQQFRT